MYSLLCNKVHGTITLKVSGQITFESDTGSSEILIQLKNLVFLLYYCVYSDVLK